MEKNWEQTSVDAGAVTEKEKLTVQFKSTKPLDIVKIEPGCGACTIIKGYKDNVLTVIYKAESIPVHLKRLQSHQTLRKIVVITYKDGNKEVLSFIVKVMKK